MGTSRPRVTESELVVHRIDEDYEFYNSRRDVSPAISREAGPDDDDPYDISRPSLMPVSHRYEDPGERIPSYESSQEQHERLVGRPDSGMGGEHYHGSQIPRGRPSHHSSPAIVTTTNMRSRMSSEPSLPRIRERDSELSPTRYRKRSLKTLGLKFLNARQHFLLAACRDLSLAPCLMGLSTSWWNYLKGISEDVPSVITTARMSEHFLTGLWCIVAGYLSYSVLDGLMVRWIVSYSTTGSILRMATMSAILVVIEQYLVSAFSAEGYNYGLHTWILISCALTMLYIVQNFITSNIDLKGKYRPRFFDVYNIVVFAVVPVGMASFITMIGLLRSLLILRLDIDQQNK